MSEVQERALVKQRLTAAAEEIFGLLAEYEEEVSRSKEQNDRQRKLLDAVLNPEVRLHRAVIPPGVQQLLEGEQLRGGGFKEEADITEFPFTPVPVKSEADEEKPQSSEPLASSSTEQMKTEADGEDRGVSEPARNLDPGLDTLKSKTTQRIEGRQEGSFSVSCKFRLPSSCHSLKNQASVNQRLTAAVEEIFGLFERTIAEYEEEIDRQRRLLEDVLKPEIQINKAEPDADLRHFVEQTVEDHGGMDMEEEDQLNAELRQAQLIDEQQEDEEEEEEGEVEMDPVPQPGTTSLGPSTAGPVPAKKRKRFADSSPFPSYDEQDVQAPKPLPFTPRRPLGYRF
ncbi:uncharacterized protein LOC144542865 [Centroberyx gerrardi]